MTSFFVTPLRVEQLDDELWRLEQPLVYYSDKLQRSLAVPPGFVTDFASVPRLPFVYWLLGGRASKAAVVHDYLYRKNAGVSRADADAIFVEAMQASGQAPWRQRLMWRGLRIGGGSSYHQRDIEWKGPPMNTTLQTHLLICLAIAAAILLSGCGLNPKQLQALDGAMCTVTEGYGVKNTTAIVAGASKNAGMMVDGTTCSIATQGKPDVAPDSKS